MRKDKSREGTDLPILELRGRSIALNRPLIDRSLEPDDGRDCTPAKGPFRALQ